MNVPRLVYKLFIASGYAIVGGTIMRDIVGPVSYPYRRRQGELQGIKYLMDQLEDEKNHDAPAGSDQKVQDDDSLLPPSLPLGSSSESSSYDGTVVAVCIKSFLYSMLPPRPGDAVVVDAPFRCGDRDAMRVTPR